MDIDLLWEKALRNTDILRPAVQGLKTFGETTLPYIFLGESSVNLGDSIIRKGTVIVEKPSIILPPNSPQFEGFDLEKEMHMGKESFNNFLFLRGVRFPSLKYNNKTSGLDVYEGRLKKAIEFFKENLEREENTNTGLVTGPEDCWQLSILIFICSQVIKAMPGDIRKMLEGF